MAINVSGENEQKKLKGYMDQCLSAMKEIDAQKDDIKAFLDTAKEEFGLKPSTLRKALNIIHKKNLAEVQLEAEDVESLVNFSENVKV